jgi:hypothetical protein
MVPTPASEMSGRSRTAKATIQVERATKPIEVKG